MSHWNERMANAWLLGIVEHCFTELLDGDDDLEVEASEIPVVIDQVHGHLVASIANAELQLVPIPKNDSYTDSGMPS